MSRGGRGRGFGRGGSLRVGGVDIPWEHDPDLVINREPEALFPPIDIPKPRAPTRLEKAQVEYFKAIRKRIHDGPYYTVKDESGDARKAERADPATFDPFDGMPSYSEKYKPFLRRVPDLSGREYELHLFPRELWDVLDPKRARDAESRQGAKRRKIAPSAIKNRGGRIESLATGARAIDGNDDTNIEGDEDGDGEDIKVEGQNEEDERSDLDPEEDFSEDEDDMADDYNAEKYFETGEGDDDDGGDGDDGGYD